MARSRNTGRRTDYEWQGLLGFQLSTIAEANQFVTLLTTNAAATLIRTRGEILYSIDGPADNDAKSLGFGIIIATDAQVTAGVTAFPSPLSVLDADWLWHGFGLLKSQSATQFSDLGGQVGRLVIDSKAMRKMKPNDNVVFVVDGANLAGTPVADVQVAARLLLGT